MQSTSQLCLNRHFVVTIINSAITHFFITL